MKKRKIIIDCDPGHDDAIALLVALASPQLDVKAITTVAGNSYIGSTTENALKILELINRIDVPVAKGASTPIINKLDVGKSIHGESGMDGPYLPKPKLKPSELSAYQMMAKVLEESDEEVVIATLGPMTNLAIFVQTYPHLISKIKYVSIMGGGLYEGNWSPIGEFNLWSDPEAVKMVINTGLDVRFYGLDVTHQAQIHPDEFHMFSNKGKVSQFVKELLDFFAISYVGDRGLPGCPMHDSCAIMGIINPEIFKYEKASIEMDLNGLITRGSLIVDRRADERKFGSINGRIYLHTEREKVRDLIINVCQILDGEVVSK